MSTPKYICPDCKDTGRVALARTVVDCVCRTKKTVNKPAVTCVVSQIPPLGPHHSVQVSDMTKLHSSRQFHCVTDDVFDKGNALAKAGYSFYEVVKHFQLAQQIIPARTAAPMIVTAGGAGGGGVSTSPISGADIAEAAKDALDRLSHLSPVAQTRAGYIAAIEAAIVNMLVKHKQATGGTVTIVASGAGGGGGSGAGCYPQVTGSGRP